MDERIEVVIAPDGSIKYEARGFAGAACEQATQHIRDAVAGAAVTSERTSEFYLDEKQKVAL